MIDTGQCLYSNLSRTSHELIERETNLFGPFVTSTTGDRSKGRYQLSQLVLFAAVLSCVLFREQFFVRCFGYLFPQFRHTNDMPHSTASSFIYGLGRVHDYSPVVLTDGRGEGGGDMRDNSANKFSSSFHENEVYLCLHAAGL